jgi:hypothetical protein
MTDYRRNAGLVEIGCHEHGGIGVGIVVPLDQLYWPTLDSTCTVDFFHGQFGRTFHGDANGVAQ